MHTFPKDQQCPPKPQRDESLIGVRPAFVAAVRKLLRCEHGKVIDQIEAFREVRRHLPPLTEGT